MSSKLVDTVTDAAASAISRGAELVEEVEEQVTKGARRAKKAAIKAEKAASKKARVAEKKLSRGKRRAEAKIEDVVELPKRKSRGPKVGKLVACMAILAGVVAAIRQFIATNDSGWQPHQPSDPYVSPSASNVAEDIADDIETDSSSI